MKKILLVFLPLCVIGFAALFTACNQPTDGTDDIVNPLPGKTLTRISITTPPDTTQYNLNEELDTTGMVVTAIYSDGSTAAVTGYTTSGYDKTKTGNQTVTVSYQGKTADFTVNVIDPEKETVATPTASPEAGAFTATQSVILTTATEGAAIYYTVDGTNPTKSSTLYSGAISIAVTTTLKAIAVKDGMNDSAILTAVYTFPIQLTENTWADGNIPITFGEQWFKFTATASTQYIHASFGTLSYMSVLLYDSSGTAVGDETSLGSVFGTTTASSSITVGQEYFIKIRSTYGSSGTYKIAFNTSNTAPPMTLPSGAIKLTENTWADGNIATTEQWFKFTATASTQYIHVSLGTLSNMSVQLYDSSGTAVGTETNLNTTSVSRSVTVGQEYYIKIRGTYSSGTYKIAFNASNTAPPITLPSSAIKLTENIWTDGNLPTSSDEQWFKFTATASTQYIHYYQGTLGTVNVQVYDSSGVAVGSQSSLPSYLPSDMPNSVSRSVTVGQEYYIRVLPSGSSVSGTYKIAFNASETAPAITLPSGAIKLTENIWTDGNLPTSSDEQWFKFTATASTQYIHYYQGTLAACRT